MDMFNLGPLPLGWECKIETKYGKLYFINHATKTTTWDDPRLATIPTPPYHIAITQPTAYFEDTIGSRWSSPLPSLKGFSLHRRGSSPRLGGSPRIAPSPTLPPRNKRNEQVILESRAAPGGSGGLGQATASGSVLQNQQQLYPYPLNKNNAANNAHAAAPAPASPAKYNYAIQDSKGLQETIPERPNSRSSGCSSFYITSASNASTHISTSHLVSCDTETAYRTVCSMFPTAQETHVRHLFHKYHNRANLVVSALQVEKHPVSSDFSSNQIEVFSPSRKNSGAGLDTDDNKSIGISSPGRGTRSYLTESPARTGTPGSLMRYSNNQSSAGSLFTKSWGSPIPPSPQRQMGRETPAKLPTKSPNMKLKYMKGIFPAADETVLLDILASCENNVQRASERLMRKGFARTPPPKPARQKWLEVKSMIEKRQKALDQQKLVNFQHEIRGEPQESPFPTPVMKTARPHVTAQQKQDAQNCLLKKFPNLPDRFISWALEVAEFQQGKAERLLKEVCPQTPEEFKPFISTADKTTSISTRTLSTGSFTIDDEDSSEKSDESKRGLVIPSRVGESLRRVGMTQFETFALKQNLKLVMAQNNQNPYYPNQNYAGYYQNQQGQRPAQPQVNQTQQQYYVPGQPASHPINYAQQPQYTTAGQNYVHGYPNQTQYQYQNPNLTYQNYYGYPAQVQSGGQYAAAAAPATIPAPSKPVVAAITQQPQQQQGIAAINAAAPTKVPGKVASTANKSATSNGAPKGSPPPVPTKTAKEITLTPEAQAQITALNKMMHELEQKQSALAKSSAPVPASESPEVGQDKPIPNDSESKRPQKPKSKLSLSVTPSLPQDSSLLNKEYDQIQTRTEPRRSQDSKHRKSASVVPSDISKPKEKKSDPIIKQSIAISEVKENPLTLTTDSVAIPMPEPEPDSEQEQEQEVSKQTEEFLPDQSNESEEQFNKENALPLMTVVKSLSKTFADKELQTPDSGYFEPEQKKTQKKGFLASLFSRKSDKSEKFFSLTSKKAKGANPSMAKGSNPALIQKTYVQALGPSQQRKGPNPNNRAGSQYQVKGPNPSLVHGPMWSAAMNKSRYSNKPSVTFDVVEPVGGNDF